MARDSDRDRDHDRSARRSRDDDPDRRARRDDGARDGRHGRDSAERGGEGRRRSRTPEASRKRKEHHQDRDLVAEKRARVSIERWRGNEDDEDAVKKVEEEERTGRRTKMREDGAEKKVDEGRRTRERRKEDDGDESRKLKDDRATRDERWDRRREHDEHERKEKEDRRSKDEKVSVDVTDGRRVRRKEDDIDRRRERRREDSVDDRREKDERRERDYGEERKRKEERKVKEERASLDESRRERRDDNGVDVDGREKEQRRRRRGFREELKVEVKEEQLSDGDGRVNLKQGMGGREEGVEGVVKDETNGRLERGVKEERKDVDVVFTDVDGSGSGAEVFALEPNRRESELVHNASAASTYHIPSKVSSVTTTIENGLINRADEVHGNFSTEGPTSMPVTSGTFSFALDKAKKALQRQKELAEKLKKIPMLDKLSSSGADSNLQVGTSKGTQRMPLSSSNVTSVTALSAPATVANDASNDASSNPAASGLPLTGTAIEAVKRAQEVAARMGFRQDPQFGPLINMFPGTVPEVAIPQKPSKAPVLRLDAQGREIDEHGNVINVPKPTNLSTLKVNINKQKKEAFQIIKPDLDANLESNPFFDARMGINKTKLLRPKRMTFQFVEEGKWSRQAEITRFKNQFGDAQAKELKTKQAQLAKAKAEPDINPNLIELSERVVFKDKQKEQIPETEWWDVPLLSTGKYADVPDDKLNMDKITIYVEHPLPIQPPAEPAPPPPQPLKLTKKETKKLRTQRRLARERDRQEMIKQGLIEPPKPKVKMSNLMKVLGAEATQDPTKLEMQIRNEAAEREQAHVDRNIARKLTPSERREKKERKLFDDPNTLETIVSVYKVNSLAHPKTRFQVDVNAHENRLTGCAVISEGVCTVVVEGGRKSNKRYKNLMLKRIDWTAVLENEDDMADDTDAPVNKCHLVWQGSVAKPNFNKFAIHQCRTDAAARKIFADAGVPHYWDLAVNFSDEVI